MLVLLTNDDGILAPGLEAAERAVRSLGWEAVVVAPNVEKSMCGHRVTTHEPLRVEQHKPDRFAVHGTPADCVRLALFALGIKPHLVVSGINAGGNMGQDIHISGTVAAAREAAYHGLPAVALSHYMKSEYVVDWPRTAEWAARVLMELTQAAQAPRTIWNVNFPHLDHHVTELPPRIRCVPAQSPLKVSFTQREPLIFDYSAAYRERPRDPGSDVEACFADQVSVSLLSI